MLRSCKISLFGFFLLSLTLNFASFFSSAAAAADGEKSKLMSQSNINTFVMKFNEKLDFLSDRVDQMEQSAGNNDAFDAVHEIVVNITRAITKTIDKFEEKQNKMEEKLNDLFHLLNASDGVRNEERNGSGRRVTSLFLSTCQDKLTAWAANNRSGSQLKTQLERMELCDSSQPKAVNMCHPNPCVNGGRCRPTSTGSDYMCVCTKYTSGSHCQYVECTVEKRCWRLKDTLYTVIETQLTWAEAKVKCEEEGMTLAMPKNEEKSRFLTGQLKAIYTTWPYLYLWIGIKRDEGGDGFYWVDGSRLGQYTGGRDNMKSQTGSWFGELWLTNDASQTWSWGAASRQWYAVCEYQPLIQ